MKPKLEINLVATTYGEPERYHPAIRNPEWEVWYWPNITFQTEAEAYDWTSAVLRSLTDGFLENMQQTVEAWNIHQAPLV